MLMKGAVVDESQKPVANASVFLNNTSIGTRADAEGKFQINIPAGRFDLIVSCVGYDTYSRSLNAGEIPSFLTVQLQTKAPEMEAVVIEPYEKDGWEKWGKFFVESFIGTSAFAQNCRIKNTETLRFKNSRRNNELTVMASEPLIIENKTLGYTIEYKLEQFSYSFKTRYLIFTGYPFFTPMKGNAKKQQKWDVKRTEAYEGSLLHFLRSVYRNQLAADGFEVRRLKKIPNLEKQRVKAIRKEMVTTGNKIRIHTSDSSKYYDKIMQEEDLINIVGKTVLPGDSIAYAVNTVTAGMDFNDFLLIIYTKKLVPVEYKNQFPKSATARMSELTLVNNNPIEIQANGSYYNPEDLMSLGFWAWSEKMATMLPYDYKLPGTK